MRYRKSFDRRTFLRGLGTVAIGLPFLECMRTRSVWAGDEEPPIRCLTLFFGLGVPKAMQQEGWDGPLGPLEPFADKLAMYRNVDMSEAGGSGHPPGGTSVFVGQGGPSKARAAGPSIDQLIKREIYPDGAPTPLQTLAVGQFFRRSHGLYQRIRCWAEDGSRAVEPIEAPSALFDRLFGTEDTSDQDAAARRARLRRSVLDTVLPDYQRLKSDAGGLSATSRARVSDHLDQVRSLERRLFEVEDTLRECTIPLEPAEPDLPYGTAGATEYDAVQVDASAFQDAWRLNVDLYVMALRCDLVRFGNLMFESSGGHTAFRGTHRANGETYSFRSEASDHNNWHEGRTNHIWWHSHFFQTNIAYALAALDDPDWVEANGGTLLDNLLLVLGTETGTNHDMNGVFHAIGGGAGRFRLGGGFHDE
ncbi:MAG: DUF1552 domain-containing protein, partial [Myxococcota bacterium]